MPFGSVHSKSKLVAGLCEGSEPILSQMVCGGTGWLGVAPRQVVTFQYISIFVLIGSQIKPDTSESDRSALI